jgi:hypothetical protein
MGRFPEIFKIEADLEAGSRLRGDEFASWDCQAD